MPELDAHDPAAERDAEGRCVTSPEPSGIIEDWGKTLLQRRLDLATAELLATRVRLQQELAARSRVHEALRMALSGLRRERGDGQAANDEGDIEQLAGQLAGLATERERTEEQLRLWAKVFEASREGIVITDERERILSVNAAVTAITGYAADELVGRTPRLLSSGRHGREFYRAMWDAIAANGYWEGEILDRRKNGEVYTKWLTIGSVHNQANQVTHYIASFTDITERKANEERIRHIAYHDALTGLPNRVLLCDRFEQEMANARRIDCRIGLLFLDFDHFKTINDSLGHPVGDKLLCAATGRLKCGLRESDIISRQGGDEFVIVLSGRGADDNIPLIARNLLDRLNEPFEIDGHVVQVSSSIGISIFPDDGDDLDTLLQKADTALYRAKADGRGTFRHFDERMNSASALPVNR